MRLKILFLFLLQMVFFSCESDSKENELKSFTLSHETLELSVGETMEITITEAPNTNAPLVWTSDNETVATVFFGQVTAVQSGTATITASLGEDTVSCVVTVPERTYELVWADEFDGTTLNTNYWTYEVNGSGGGNNEAQYYTDRPENIRVEDGKLIIEARKEEYLGKQYTSARIITKDKVDLKYGKVEARLKVPKGRGTWPAFWMLGYGSWPRAGEIDIMEHVGYQPNVFHCALHTLTKNGMNGQNPHGEQYFDYAVADEFHVITMEWVENEFMGFDRIHIYVDGVKTKTFAETPQLQDSGDWPFNDKFFFILNLAIGGSWGGAQGIDDSMFDEPVRYEIDYVRAYQLN
ncbi:family 16 glycosylhydrolase [Sediminitomix flava]|uniref:Beta-glucanase (GH16 family) n=1 Tax=Sediminitomix flava TaxID=379075 RepID=A0A315ZDG3_SEDFL|nr:family 16 glycosylhydrolase [Sediminitomix flava]PWJ42908.1 beta-glucanase (GH16 family) [Sediminitomix flava]